MFKRSLLILIIFLNIVSISYAIEKAERISDREIVERLTKIETKLEEGQKASNQRFDDINGNINNIRADINNLRNFMTWGFGVLFSGFCMLMGFVLWDRRAALAPAVRKNKELEEREDKMEKVLKEYARQDTRLADIMKQAGLL